MAETIQYKCPCCGGRLEFDSGLQKMKCPYCDTTFDVETLDEAVRRARTIAAPKNEQRFLGKTPCAQTGCCADCHGEECICNQILITRNCRPAGRIHVILVGEELGF